MELNKNDNSFTFTIENGMPKITINGNKLAIVECEYYWTTATECSPCKTYANISGYIHDEIKLRIFELNFITNKVKEIIINGGNNGTK